MKPAATLCLLILLTASAAASLASPADPVQQVKIAEDRASDWRIVCPPPASPVINWGAGELQRYLRQISGCKLAIVKRVRGKPALAVGLRPELSPKDRAVLPPAAKGYDGYAVAVVAGTPKTPARIVIAGDNARGVIYGIYDVLERLGCRWFYPTEDAADPEVVPVQSTISLPAGSWAVASPMKHRICNGSAWFFEMEAGPARKQIEWAMKARYNAMGWQADTHTPLETQYRQLADTGLLAALKQRDMFLHGPAHCFNLLLRAEDYLTNHPDWFGLRDGKRVPQAFAGAQFCWSNPEARKQFTDNAAAFARQAKQINILCLVPFDGGQACECEPCKKAGASNLLMLLMAEVIERLKTCRPDLLVETVGGYGAMTDPPDTARIHPQQRVVWAHWGRVYTMGYDDPRYDRKDNLEKWRRAARGGVTLCQYYTDNFAEPWVMSPFTVAMEGDRRYFREKGIDSVYMLMWPRGYWWNHGLNGYLAGRCFHDFSLSPYDLLRDYARHYFGPEAGALLADYHEAWARDPELCYRVRGDSRDADRARLADQRKRLLEPAARLVASEPMLARRLGKVEKLHTLAERLMEVHRQRDDIQRLRRAGQFAPARAQLERARAYTDEVLALFYTLADLNQGLIERKEVPTFITANVKNWIEEEAKAIAAGNKE
ncbi:MAG TPA: DUF4838 domain-containing protein [Candidatus Paceibacterota bacterium]|nr:DUF4838 domain-containing protein [Verrucomicrobiota bacterium]HSA09020.1 DUF4838 domain-containing protein [Candidatus Paceibacterota bacterium]